MVLVRTLHNRGTNIVVEANGEVLFAPTGDIGVWTRRFSRKVTGFAAGFAPANKRPRWGHYGKPLKDTFTSSTKYAPLDMKVYAAIGSTSPHAYYVDQGTGVFNDSGPYPAKILPPWAHGSPSLYEHTWRPGGGRGSRRVGPVMIKGQRGQGFMDKGVKRGFEFMRMRSFQVPGDGTISHALSSFPEGLANFKGNTEASPGFIASLTEWRAWRDAAYNKGEQLGRNAKPGFKRSQHLAQQAALSKSRAAVIQRQIAADKALAASKAAAERREKAQKKALLDAKKIRDKARADRAERERLARLNDARLRGMARGQKLKNMDYHVVLRPVKNKYGTEVIGYDLLYSDLKGVHHVEHFR